MPVIYVWCFASVVQKKSTTNHTTQFMIHTEEGSVLYLYTKFEADSSIRSKNIRGPKIWKLGHVTPATPTYGSFYGPYAVKLPPLCLC